MIKLTPLSRRTTTLLLAFAPILLLGQPAPPAPAAAPAPLAPSSIAQPALSSVESTLTSLKLDKWKKGSIRDEAGENIKAILRDIKTNVPPLLSEADAAPANLSKSIPLAKHLDALYDVVLRVEEGARVSGPTDQVEQLESTLKQFGTARNQFYDAMTDRAVGQEKQVTDLQSTIKSQKAALEQKPAPAPAPVPCTPPKPAAKKKRPAPKPAQPATGQPPQTPPKPQ